jgi:hypothetical protein
MAIFNLLKMTQMILSSMDGDEITDVEETVESRQVVDIIEQTWLDVLTYLNLPEHSRPFELIGSGDPAKPTLLTLPSGVRKVEWIKYDVSEGNTERKTTKLTPRLVGEFFDAMNTRDTADTTTYQFNYVVGSDTFDVRGRNDKEPTSYTVLQDQKVLFDNYNLAIENTIVGNKTECFGLVIPDLQRVNTWLPPVDQQNFSYFFNEAKSQCFVELKQVANSKADGRARRALVEMQRTKQIGPDTRPEVQKAANFGRRSRVF